MYQLLLLFLLAVDRSQNPIRAHRYLSGYGKERGGIVVTFHNFDVLPVKITYLESVPWFLKIYLHTLSASSQSLENGCESFINFLIHKPMP
jgi:phosphatidylinositol glycan class T